MIAFYILVSIVILILLTKLIFGIEIDWDDPHDKIIIYYWNYKHNKRMRIII